MKKFNFLFLALALVAGLGFTVVSCKEDEPEPASLYKRLGEKQAIEAVIDQFLSNVLADSRISPDFAETAASPARTTALRNNLVDQVCNASGGPCEYKGKTMKAAHAGQNVTEADFTALVEDLIAALNTFNVPQAEQTELINILATLKNDIVGQ